MKSGTELVKELERLESEALDAVEKASGEEELEAVRIEYLGRSEGNVSSILRTLGELEPEDRPRVGAAANRVKATVTEALEKRREELAATGGEGAPTVDLTLPSRREWVGGRHPVTRVIDEICEIFAGLGFTRARGREAETDWYNFEALNTPLDHPAADEQDTFYLAPGILLRSHTSPVQIRTMQAYDPPIRILAPGMVYRRDTADATHTPAFMQIEGLAVDEGITFVDLKATLAEFARRIFGPGTEVRFRPSFFPFTEPSAEVDVKRVTTREDGTVEEGEWLEIMGAGMVDPAVLEAVGYDPERYTGFAFGMGPARIASLRYQIPDIRSFFESDVRFLRQFA
ncbi:MAG: phenylalanine--tRNA ligase subunit alpha [Longimicrobiales bacterium]